jgi:P4 family phage/plasmid primase-like protien
MNVILSKFNDPQENPNLVSLPPMAGKWFIKEDYYQDFLKEYSEYISKGNIAHLTELHGKYSPILIDLDFKFSIDTGCERKYSFTHLHKISKILNECIQVALNVDKEKLVTFVFEKKSPYKYGGYIKDGLHIVYPFIITSPDIQYHIRTLFISKLDGQLCDLPYINSIDEIVDKSVIHSSGWFLYKSSKPNLEPYLLTHIFDDTQNEINHEYSDYELTKMLSIQYKTENVESKIKLNSEISNYPNGNIENVDSVKSLCDMLNVERSDDRSSWIDVGLCLYNINDGLLGIWKEFSKKSEKYKGGECEKIWSTFTKDKPGRKLTIASLNMWARVDNPQKYLALKRDESSDMLAKSLDCTHYGVALILYVKYKFHFVCSSIKHDTWWEYTNHRWKRMDKASSLRTKISTEIANDYMVLSNLYKRRALANPAEKDELMEMYKKAKKCMLQTQQRGFKDNVIKEAADMFLVDDFESTLDKHTDLIGFENGVYDLSKGEFRDGCPDDLLTLSTKMDYIRLNESKYTNDVVDFLTKVVPEDDVRKYVMTLVSSFLSGKTGEQKFHIWTGSGGNGKSKFIELIESTFGEYSVKVPVTLLTGKRASSGAATPELSNCKGRRFLSFQEPEKEDKIHVGHMKELSGGDKIMARPMYLPPIEFKPQFKMILACNDLPTIPSDDNGTWRRIRVVDFPSRFVDEPNPEEQNEYKKDIYIDEKIPQWRQTFMSMLLECYKKYKNGGKLVEPESVMKFTRDYQQKSDIFMDFVNEKLDKTDNKKDVLNITNAYTVYKSWHVSLFSEKAPNRNVFKDSMEKRFGAMRNGWKGIKLKDDFTEED